MIAGLLIIGLVLIASSLKNTWHELGDQVQGDVLGQDGFLAWAGAILAIGAIGYLPGLRTASRSLLLLLGTVMIVRNGGVWANAQTALVAASSAGPAPSVPAATPGSGSSSAGGTTGGNSSGPVTTGTFGSSGGGDSTTSTLTTVAEIAALALL